MVLRFTAKPIKECLCQSNIRDDLNTQSASVAEHAASSVPSTGQLYDGATRHRSQSFDPYGNCGARIATAHRSVWKRADDSYEPNARSRWNIGHTHHPLLLDAGRGSGLGATCTLDELPRQATRSIRLASNEGDLPLSGEA
jgi:hypothetical protein